MVDDILAAARLDELVVELGVPLGRGASEEVPFVLPTGRGTPTPGPRRPEGPEVAAAFNVPAESASKPAAVELDGGNPPAERAAALFGKVA